MIKEIAKYVAIIFTIVSGIESLFGLLDRLGVNISVPRQIDPELIRDNRISILAISLGITVGALIIYYMLDRKEENKKKKRKKRGEK